MTPTVKIADVSFDVPWHADTVIHHYKIRDTEILEEGQTTVSRWDAERLSDYHHRLALWEKWSNRRRLRRLLGRWFRWPSRPPAMSLLLTHNQATRTDGGPTYTVIGTEGLVMTDNQGWSDSGPVPIPQFGSG